MLLILLSAQPYPSPAASTEQRLQPCFQHGPTDTHLKISWNPLIMDFPLHDEAFPCALCVRAPSNDLINTNIDCPRTITLPLPTHRLAFSAFRALSVDAELSPLVRRSFFLTISSENSSKPRTAGVAEINLNGNVSSNPKTNGEELGKDEDLTVLRIEYKATTNRMLRVAVNGFMESLGVVLGVMEELDVDVLEGGGI